MWSAELGCCASTDLTRIFKGVEMPQFGENVCYPGCYPDVGGTFTEMA